MMDSNGTVAQEVNKARRGSVTHLAVHDDWALDGLLGLLRRHRRLGGGRRRRRHHGGPLQVAALRALLTHWERLSLHG